jgi:hypothetical protein
VAILSGWVRVRMEFWACRKMIEVNSINTISFLGPSNCNADSSAFYALFSQQQLDEDYAINKSGVNDL